MRQARVHNESGLRLELSSDMQTGQALGTDLVSVDAAQLAALHIFMGREKVGRVIVRRAAILEIPTVTIEVDIRGEKSSRAWESSLATRP